ILITAILNKRLTALDAFGFLFGLAGTLSLIDPLKLDWSNPLSCTGELSLVLAALSWSIGILATLRLKWHNSPQKSLLWLFFIATLITNLYSRWSGFAFLPVIFNFILICSFLYTGVLVFALGFWFIIILSICIVPVITSNVFLWVTMMSHSKASL